MKKYEAPKLTVQDFVADTIITSGGGGGGGPKGGNAGNNQNCWACNETYGQVIGENICMGSGIPGC